MTRFWTTFYKNCKFKYWKEFIDLTKWCLKISYYWFNKHEIWQIAKEKYSKERTAEYYLQNKEAIKEKTKNRYKRLVKKRKIQD